MKIVLLVSAMNRGGAERVAATLCNAWAERGDAVRLVITWSGRGACEYPLADGVRPVWLADLAARNGKLLGYWSRLAALRRFLRDEAPDVVVSFLTNVNLTTLLATRGLGVPVIVSERIDPLASDEFSAGLRRLCRWIYPRAEAIAVQTESIRKAMRTMVPRAQYVEVIPNPVPEALLAHWQPGGRGPAPGASEPSASAPGAPAPDASGRDAPAPGVSAPTPSGAPRAGPTGGSPQRAGEHGARRRLVAMGRLSAQKQLDQLVAMFAELAPLHPDVDLWIWGEGELRPALEAQVAAAGLGERVFLPGRTDAPWAEMAAGEVLVLSSAYEGFPNVMLEAMALGLPCVAYDCPSGPAELSDGGRAAVLVPLNDRARLRDETARLLADPGQAWALGARAASTVRERYRLQAVLEAWDRLIHRARERRGYT